MRKFGISFAVTIALMMSYSGSASATIVVCEPDNFTVGTALATACAGVTLSVEQRTTDIVVSEVPGIGAASTGTRVFGHSLDDFGWGSSDGNPETFRADFAALTSFISLDFIGNDSSDQGSLWIYDSTSTLLSTINTGIFSSGVIKTLSYSSLTSNIGFIRAAGTGGDNLNLDNLQFSVPGPSSLSLIGLGLLGLVMTRRRRSAV